MVSAVGEYWIAAFILLCLAGTTSAKCPPGYIQGLTDDVCYYTSHEAVAWADAEEDCVNRGGHLASISNAFQNSLIRRSGYAGSVYWVGASRGVTTSTNWTWTDGTAFNWTNWDSGQPDTGIPSCIDMDMTTGVWYSFNCANELYYVCAVKSTVEPVKNCPKPEPTCPSGWTYFAVTDKCYSLVFNARYYEALTQCENEGATLASIHNSEANDVLLRFAAKNLQVTTSTSTNWIGLHSPGNSGAWEWTDGSAYDFNNWDGADGFPLKANGANQSCAYAHTDVAPTDPQVWYHHWYNWGSCDIVRASAICQKNPSY